MSFGSSDNFCLKFLERIRELKLQEIMSCRAFKWVHMQTGDHATRQSKVPQTVKGLRSSWTPFWGDFGKLQGKVPLEMSLEEERAGEMVKVLDAQGSEWNPENPRKKPGVCDSSAHDPSTGRQRGRVLRDLGLAGIASELQVHWDILFQSSEVEKWQRKISNINPWPPQTCSQMHRTHIHTLKN